MGGQARDPVMSTSEVVILSGCRTAVGAFGGAFKDVSAVELGTVVVREAVRRAGVRPEDVDEVVLGCILQAGLGMNPARQAALKAGLPDSVPAHTVNKVCGSGLKAVMLATQAVRCGDAEVVVAGGMESMSRAPFLLPGARWGERLGHGRALDHMIHEGLTDALHDIHMGVTAENLAERYRISRAEQEPLRREPGPGGAAIREGRFKTRSWRDVPDKKGARQIDPTSIRARAPPWNRSARSIRVQKDGTVTRGMRAHQRRRGRGGGDERAAGAAAGPLSLARIVSYASAEVDPRVMGIGPGPAVRKALERAGLGAERNRPLGAHEPSPRRARPCCASWRWIPHV